MPDEKIYSVVAGQVSDDKAEEFEQFVQDMGLTMSKLVEDGGFKFAIICHRKDAVTLNKWMEEHGFMDDHHRAKRVTGKELEEEIEEGEDDDDDALSEIERQLRKLL